MNNKGVLILGGNDWLNRNVYKSLIEHGEYNYSNIRLGINMAMNNSNQLKQQLLQEFDNKIQLVDFCYKRPETHKPVLSTFEFDKLFLGVPSSDMKANEQIEPFLHLIQHGGPNGKIKKLIYLSTLAIDDGLPTLKCEEMVSALSINYCILRPTCFLENFTIHMKYEIKRGLINSPTTEKGRTAWVSAEDVGNCCAILLSNDQHFKLYQSKRIPLTNSKSLNIQEIMQMISQYLKREIKVNIISLEQFNDEMVNQYHQPADSSKYVTLVSGAIENGHLNVVDTFLEDIICKKPMSAEQFIINNLQVWK